MPEQRVQVIVSGSSPNLTAAMPINKRWSGERVQLLMNSSRTTIFSVAKKNVISLGSTSRLRCLNSQQRMRFRGLTDDIKTMIANR
jgi:hypothetical protein